MVRGGRRVDLRVWWQGCGAAVLLVVLAITLGFLAVALAAWLGVL